MFSFFVRFLLILVVSFTIIHAYPSPMIKVKWQPARVARPYLVPVLSTPDYLNSPVEDDEDMNDSNGFATWLFRSRKFCCAPPM